ncbi:MAG: hypothetical protein B7Z81_04265, partial [Acidocella sp. 20-61-6]
MKLGLGAFPPEAPFLASLAATWLQAEGDAANGVILLPTRRAAQALAGAFLEANGNQALLLPRIIATGAIDEAGLALTAALDLPPAIAPLRRQAILARLILARGADAAPNLPAAWALARDLATLLDEADTAEINLAHALPGLVPAELAAHWQKTLEFLEILTQAWPAILQAEQKIDPAARQMALLDAQAAAWRERPPEFRVWLVAAEGPPALARLAAVIAGLPAGRVILPGFDFALLPEDWEALEDSHPQAGIARLLAALGAAPGDVERVAPAAARSATLSRALLPAASLAAWQKPATLDVSGLALLNAPDEAASATAIAMVLREALEVPGRTAALITPDRALARRVAAELARFGVAADDSAGEGLAETPPAVFLRLAARALAEQFAPLPLLALLQHPLTAAGLPPELCRENARRLERAALRGPRPAPGFDGVKFRLAEPKHGIALAFLERLENLLRDAVMPVAINPAEALRRLLAAGEALAETPELPGPARLWSGEAGAKLAELCLEAMAALETLPDIPAADLPALLDALLEGAVVRRPRTKDGHPRVAIWGIQEAALQQVDLAVLGGLGVGDDLADLGLEGLGELARHHRGGRLGSGVGPRRRRQTGRRCLVLSRLPCCRRCRRC